MCEEFEFATEQIHNSLGSKLLRILIVGSTCQLARHLATKSPVGPVRLTLYPVCSASFFNQNNVFLSQQYNKNNIFQSVSAKIQQAKRAYKLGGGLVAAHVVIRRCSNAVSPLEVQEEMR